ncbi:MAG: inositol monophosphatase family protein [Planctomycetota bacterium]|jgi:3'(2'), 5'-bisphosphate nucleotidase|nr:inositol monophosphatase family protein [Planctomycetota bacterium]
MSDSLQNLVASLNDVALKCARLCRTVQAEMLSAMDKTDKSPVTIADYGCQALIHREIMLEYPSHGLISEEGSEHLRTSASEDEISAITQLVSDAVGQPTTINEICSWIDHRGDQNSDFIWSIDPIDGTKGFLRKAQYAIAIGLLQASRPVAGTLVCPNLPYNLDDDNSPIGALLSGWGPGTATKMAIDSGQSEPISSNAVTEPSQMRVLGSVESSHGDPKLVTGMMAHSQIGGGFVRYDSQAKYAVIAMGGAEMYVRPRSKPDYRENIWDHVAGVAVCESAGAIVSDVDGKALDFSHGAKLLENRGILATANERAHELAIEGIRHTESG